jgi:Spy/CpxP family protein refolding chaperone
MKKLILAGAIAFGTLTVNAQSKSDSKGTSDKKGKTEKAEGEKKRPDAETRAKKQTERMTNKLSLTEDQKAKVNTINIAKNKQVDAAFAAKKDEKDPVFVQERKRINKERYTEIRALLTPEQLEKLNQLKKAKKDGKGKKDKKGGTSDKKDGTSTSEISKKDTDGDEVIDELLGE